MFCEQCGKKFGPDAKFCGGCGTPREAENDDYFAAGAQAGQDETTTVTPFDVKVQILATLWAEFEGDPDWKEFFDSQDLGLPLAFMMSTRMLPKDTALGKPGEDLINESFDVLLAAMGIPADSGFENLDQIVLDENA